MNYTITNSWEDITIVCLNRHKEPIPMVIETNGSSPFYACPKYKEHAIDEHACNNRLSMEDYSKMLQHIHNLLGEAEMNDQRLNLTNYAWHDRKGTTFTVLSHLGDKMVISVHNKKAINS